jgi:hypothetical protein
MKKLNFNLREFLILIPAEDSGESDEGRSLFVLVSQQLFWIELDSFCLCSQSFQLIRAQRIAGDRSSG